VINGQTDTVTATIGLPGRPEDVAVNPTTHYVYAVNRMLADIWKISGTTDKVFAKRPLPGPSSDVATDPAGNTVYTTPNSGGTHDLTVLKG
jgi:DNA-binding beta-propeller fold protein YncE